MTNVKAKLNYVRISPRKVRLIADLVRGKSAEKAISQLSFLVKKSSKPIKKLLESAVANAKNNFKIDKTSNLYVKEIKVDEGPELKRYRARAFGRAAMVRKKTSHVSLVLAEKENKIQNAKIKMKNDSAKSKMSKS